MAHSLNELETKIGYTFKDKALLTQALTHSSKNFDGRANKVKNTHSNHYERLEFLGDRVLGLVIAELLFTSFPYEHEGELNLRFAQLVRKESCTIVATKLALGDFVLLGSNEEKSGLNSNPTILGDVCEALIAAIYLDGGIEIAKPFILKQWNELITTNLPNKQDAKTALQEWAQKLKLQLPSYKVASTTGPAHSPEFTIEVKVGTRQPASASGQSKRIAEQKAATAFLMRENIWN